MTLHMKDNALNKLVNKILIAPFIEAYEMELLFYTKQ